MLINILQETKKDIASQFNILFDPSLPFDTEETRLDFEELARKIHNAGPIMQAWFDWQATCASLWVINEYTGDESIINNELLFTYLGDPETEDARGIAARLLYHAMDNMKSRFKNPRTTNNVSLQYLNHIQSDHLSTSAEKALRQIAYRSLTPLITNLNGAFQRKRTREPLTTELDKKININGARKYQEHATLLKKYRLIVLELIQLTQLTLLPA